MSNKYKKFLPILIAGIVTGVCSVLLTVFGNPANMGFCIACFLRDTAGALGMHGAAPVQYVRPEIIGLVVGALVVSLVSREFKPQSGSAPLTRFVLGIVVMIGSLVFLGCPLRMIIRLGGGDLNALVGLAGFVAGVGGGVLFLNKGFSLGRAYTQTKTEGFMPSALVLAVLAFLVVFPTMLIFSESGPGSMHAPVAVSLIAGLAVGGLAQRSRLCTMGGVRDAYMFRDFTLLTGFLAIFLTVFIGNLITGKLNIGFADQPIAHTEWLWNFLGMALVGVASVFLGGCPLRQLILAGSGSGDAGITVLGLIAGAAICHNFGLASSAAGTTPAGRVAVLIGFLVCGAIGFTNIRKKS